MLQTTVEAAHFDDITNRSSVSMFKTSKIRLITDHSSVKVDRTDELIAPRAKIAPIAPTNESHREQR